MSRVRVRPVTGSDGTWAGPVSVAALTDVLPLTRLLREPPLTLFKHVRRLLFTARSATAGANLLARVVWSADGTRLDGTYAEATASTDGAVSVEVPEPAHEWYGLQAYHSDGVTPITDVEWQVWAVAS